MQHFLSPDRPLLPSVVDHLLALGDELRYTLVIVPTAHSGRRLRQALPVAAGRPILAPHVQTPESAFRPRNDSPAAPKLLWWAAWAEVLKSATDAEIEPLFENTEALTRDARWALNSAREFTQIKDELAEVDAGFDRPALFSEEPDRWNALHQLDLAATKLLQSWGAYCPAECKRNAAVHWSPPEGCRRIVLACVPDAVPLSLRAWRNSQDSLPIDVLIHADSSMAGQFDSWGRPIAKQWKDFHLSLPEDENAWLNLSVGPHQLARQCVESCKLTPNTDIALGIADKDFSPAVEEAFAEAGWDSFDPDGRRVSTMGIWALLRSLRALLGSPNQFREVPDLIKCPEAKHLLDLSHPHRCAKDIDHLRKNFLPQSLTHAISKAENIDTHSNYEDLISSLKSLEKLLSEARTLSAHSWLAQIFDRLENAPGFPDELKESFTDALDAITHLTRHRPDYPVAEAMDLLLAQIESTRIDNDRAGTAIDLLGWLELAYETAPHLRLIGLHEGLVPDRPTENGLITESLRTKLGLRDRSQREARDAYLLDSFLRARQQQGSVQIFISQADAAGNTRQASRLLLRCPSHQLSRRVTACFREDLEDSQRVPSYSRADWTLTLPHSPLRYKDGEDWTLSPSLLADYLRCPFRFYLKRGLGFHRSDFDHSELDQMEFGNLIHYVLEAYGNDAALRELSTQSDISAALIELLDQRFDKQFGNQYNLALSIQKDSASRRLQHFAASQADAYQNGWRIDEVELAIGTNENETPWQYKGQNVRMRIDRIDRNIDTGAIRLIDYKSGSAKSPEEKHLDTIKAHFDERFLWGPKAPAKGPRGRAERRWVDLQLPLYAEYARQRWNELPVVAYANLPIAASETGFSEWTNYDETLHENALEWVDGVVNGIRSGFFEVCQLSSSESMYDDFAALAPDDLKAAFALPQK